MSITFEWKITQLKGSAVNGAISEVHWTCIATDTENNNTLEEFGTEPFFPDTSSELFVPYESLTEETVLDWVWTQRVSKTDIETLMSVTLQEKSRPPVMLELPWQADTNS